MEVQKPKNQFHSELTGSPLQSPLQVIKHCQGEDTNLAIRFTVPVTGFVT